MKGLQQKDKLCAPQLDYTRTVLIKQITIDFYSDCFIMPIVKLEIENARPAIPKESPKPREVPEIPNPVNPPTPTPKPVEAPPQKVPSEKPRTPVPV